MVNLTTLQARRGAEEGAAPQGPTRRLPCPLQPAEPGARPAGSAGRGRVGRGGGPALGEAGRGGPGRAGRI